MQLSELTESDFYNLLPNPDKNDEADPDSMFINPQSDYYSRTKLNNALNSTQGKGIFSSPLQYKKSSQKSDPIK